MNRKPRTASNSRFLNRKLGSSWHHDAQYSIPAGNASNPLVPKHWRNFPKGSLCRRKHHRSCTCQVRTQTAEIRWARAHCLLQRCSIDRSQPDLATRPDRKVCSSLDCRRAIGTPLAGKSSSSSWMVLLGRSRSDRLSTIFPGALLWKIDPRGNRCSFRPSTRWQSHWRYIFHQCMARETSFRWDKSARRRMALGSPRYPDEKYKLDQSWTYTIFVGVRSSMRTCLLHTAPYTLLD